MTNALVPIPDPTLVRSNGLWCPRVVASNVDGSREAVCDGALRILVDPSDQGDIRAGMLEALRRPKGVIPQGLDYFSYINFERWLHRILENVVSTRK
jgi:phosphatidyl-myo-inositol dimannoside synthase